MEDFKKKILYKGTFIENLSKEELLEALEILYEENITLEGRLKDLYKRINP